VEPVAAVRVAGGVDADALAAVAARTFPLACPPTVTPTDIAAFIAAELSAARFADYLADPARTILTVASGVRIAGYAMLVRDETGDPPPVELSKMYVLPDYHGSAVAGMLMDAALAAAAAMGAGEVWLGVNQRNHRAQRFYTKHGFTINGTRTFRVGDTVEHDYVMTRAI
jgi:ribosomal protein S18 acetylase RimI-like enzyme